MPTDYDVLKRGLLAALNVSVRHILEATRPNITGSARLQMLGLYLSVVVLTDAGEDATAKRISEFTGHHRSHVNKMASELFLIGVLGREQMAAATGHTFQYRYYPVIELGAVREFLQK